MTVNPTTPRRNRSGNCKRPRGRAWAQEQDIMQKASLRAQELGVLATLSITHPLPQYAATPFLPLAFSPSTSARPVAGSGVAPEAASILGLQSPVDQDHG